MKIGPSRRVYRLAYVLKAWTQRPAVAMPFSY